MGKLSDELPGIYGTTNPSIHSLSHYSHRQFVAGNPVFEKSLTAFQRVEGISIKIA
jgi:hypothetical protein